jgi:O-antigen/teichoic acid export membrane protein
MSDEVDQGLPTTTVLRSWLAIGKRLRSRLSLARLAQPLAAASIGSLAIYIFGAGLSYIAQLVIARAIGSESFGIFAYVMAWITLLAYLSTLGFQTSLLRFIPAYRVGAQWPLIRGVIQFSQRRVFVAGLIVTAIGACIVMAFKDSMQPELAATFLIGLVSVPFFSLHLIYTSMARTFGGVVTALAPERIVRDGVILLIVAALAFSQVVHLDARVAMAASLISALVTLGVLRVLLRRIGPPELISNEPIYAKRDWYQPTLPLMISVIADNLMSRSGVIVLGMSGSTSQAGIFSVALSMSLLCALPRIAVATAFAPNVSDLHARKDHVGLQKLAAKAALLSFFGTACVAVPLLLFNGYLLSLFGMEFVAGRHVVFILVIGQLFSALSGPQQHLITMTGHERYGATMMAVSAVLNLTTCIVTFELLGMTGAALAMTATIVAWNVAMGIFIYRWLNLVPGPIAAIQLLLKKGNV